MKAQIRISALSFIAVVCFSTILSSQEEEKKFQIFHVTEDFVKPSKVFEYEENLKEYINFLREHHFKYPVHVHRTDDFRYYLSTPIKPSGAELDSINKAYGAMLSTDEIKEKWGELFEKFAGNYHYSKSFLMIWRSQLSYSPSQIEYKPEESHFFELTYIHVKVGKEKEFKELHKKWKELYTKNNINYGVETYEGLLGTERPIFYWMTRAKDAVDFYKKIKERSNKLDNNKESEELWKATLNTIEKIDTKTGVYLSELSYEPEKK